MKKISFILTAILAMTFVSCQKEQELQEGGPATFAAKASGETVFTKLAKNGQQDVTVIATTSGIGIREQLTATFAIGGQADVDKYNTTASQEMQAELLPLGTYEFKQNDVTIDRYNRQSRSAVITVSNPPSLQGEKWYVLPVHLLKVTGSGLVDADTLSTVCYAFYALNIDKGEGTQDKPYLIYEVDDLLEMGSKIAHIGSDAIKTKEAFEAATPTYFKMINDIDLSGKEWKPLNSSSPYDQKISFDGNHKTISNLSYQGSGYGGMFGVLCGEVHDLNLIDAKITTNKDKSGLLSGYLGTGDVIYGVVHGCKITGTLTVDNNSVGGVAGLMCGGEISECDVNATIVQLGNNRYYCGGIVGCGNKKAGIIRNCIFDGSVESAGNLDEKTYNRNVSGICGAFETPGYVIENCISLGTVHCNVVVAGILGHANNNSWGAKTADAVDNSVIGCIAWNESLLADNSRTVSQKLSRDDYAMGGGCIMGWGCPENTLMNCWRKANINFKVTCPDDPKSETHFVPFDQDNAGPGTPLKGIDCNYSDLWSSMYHGKAAATTETASQVAKRIGWSEEIWDLSADVPSLKSVKAE